jgi:hypothetical protein
LLGLPWTLALEEWPAERFVEAERGIGRHVVRFVELNGRLYALKELPERLAAREYRLLIELEHSAVPAVAAVGIVDERRDTAGRCCPRPSRRSAPRSRSCSSACI